MIALPRSRAALGFAISAFAWLGSAGLAVAHARECVAVPTREGTALEDATALLQAALRSDVACVRVPHDGQPWIVRPLVIQRDRFELVLDPGVELVAKAGEFHGPTDALLTLQGVRDVKLRGRGATLRMRRDDYEHPPYRSSEWRHALVLRGSSRVEIADLTIEDAGGDGIYLGGAGPSGPSNEDVWIHDVVVDRSLRQGLSVITARRLVVEDSVFRRSGPRPPAAGIDIEPNHPYEPIEAVVVRRCLMLDNHGLGMHTWLRHLDASSAPVSIVWEHNVVRGSPIGIHGTGAAQPGPRGTVAYRNNVVFGGGRAGVWLRQHGDGALAVRFEHDLLVRDEASGVAAIVLEGHPSRRFGAVEFAALVVAGEASSQPVRVVGHAGEPWSAVQGTVVLAHATEIDAGPPGVPGLAVLASPRVSDGEAP